MKRITYISRKKNGLTKGEIKSISETSSKNNAKVGLSGVLISGLDHFIQILEGPVQTVDETYQRISNDPRHTDLIMLKSEYPITKRIYEQWDMKFINISEELSAGLSPMDCMVNAITEARAALKAYTQQEVLDQFALGLNPLHIQPKKVCKNIIFADIMGFTALTERLDIDAVVSLLNLVFGMFCEEVQLQGGAVNKMIGDGVLAYFPEDKAEAAVETAVRVLEKLERVKDQAIIGDPLKRLDLGVGIDRGFVIEGNIGSYFKKDFTIIGDVVNMASRIEKLSRRVDAHIICSEQIKQSCQHINMRSLGAFRVRGVDDKIEVFTPSNSDQA